MNRPKYAFFKGKIVPIDEAHVSVMTHALNYGTAAFGGIRAYWNADDSQLYIFRPRDHFTRLRSSAKLLMIDLPYSAEDLTNILVDLLRQENQHENMYIRPLIYISQEGIGVKLHDLPSEFTMFAFPYGSYLAKDDSLNVGFSSWRRVDDNMIPARGKISGAYVNSALIKTEAIKSGYDEALVLNEDGHISEASAANFVMIRNGKAITPPNNANVLEGITLRTVMTLLSEVMGVEVVERNIDRTEVYNAEEAFFCGTGVQIASIGTIDHRTIGTGQIGPIVSELRRLFFEAVQGKLPDYQHWVQPVFTSESISTHKTK